MTTPLELAELLEEGPHRAGDAFIAAELRRLAQVEAEHAALLKAISDAEPVAWRAEHQSGDWVLRETPTTPSTGIFTGRIEPLYTLNGIKKP